MESAADILRQIGQDIVRKSEAMKDRERWLADKATYFKDETVPRAERVDAWQRLSKSEQEIIKGLMK